MGKYDANTRILTPVCGYNTQCFCTVFSPAGSAKFRKAASLNKRKKQEKKQEKKTSNKKSSVKNR